MLIRHSSSDCLTARRVGKKLHCILMRISCDRTRQVGDGICPDCSAACAPVVKAGRIFRTDRQGRMHICGRTVVKIHRERTHAVIAQEAGDGSISRAPGKRFGRCHRSVVHSNCELSCHASASHIAEASVTSLNIQLTCRIACIYAAMIYHTASSGNGQCVSV